MKHTKHPRPSRLLSWVLTLALLLTAAPGLAPAAQAGYSDERGNVYLYTYNSGNGSWTRQNTYSHAIDLTNRINRQSGVFMLLSDGANIDTGIGKNEHIETGPDTHLIFYNPGSTSEYWNGIKIHMVDMFNGSVTVGPNIKMNANGAGGSVWGTSGSNSCYFNNHFTSGFAKNINGTRSPGYVTYYLDQQGGTGGTTSFSAPQYDYLPFVQGSVRLPTKTGYTFNGYFYNGTQIYGSNGVIVQPNGSFAPQPYGYVDYGKTFTAGWSAKDVGYQVNHYVMDTTGNYPSTPTDREYRYQNSGTLTGNGGLSDSSGSIDPLIKKGAGYDDDQSKTSFAYANWSGTNLYGQSGAYSSGNNTNKNATFKVSPSGGTTINLYYTRASYPLSLSYGGTAGLAYAATGASPSVVNNNDGGKTTRVINPRVTNNTWTGTIYYDADIKLQPTLSAGYEFMGWEDKNVVGTNLSTLAKDYAFHMPTHSVSLMAKAVGGFFANDAAEINFHKMAGPYDAKVTVTKDGAAYTGSKVTLVENGVVKYTLAEDGSTGVYTATMAKNSAIAYAAEYAIYVDGKDSGTKLAFANKGTEGAPVWGFRDAAVSYYTATVQVTKDGAAYADFNGTVTLTGQTTGRKYDLTKGLDATYTGLVTPEAYDAKLHNNADGVDRVRTGLVGNNTKQTFDFYTVSFYTGYDVTEAKTDYYDVNGLYSPVTAWRTQVVYKGEASAIPTLTPERKVANGEEFSFSGWKTAKDAPGGALFDFKQPVTAKTTLYANWLNTTNAEARWVIGVDVYFGSLNEALLATKGTSNTSVWVLKNAALSEHTATDGSGQKTRAYTLDPTVTLRTQGFTVTVGSGITLTTALGSVLDTSIPEDTNLSEVTGATPARAGQLTVDGTLTVNGALNAPVFTYSDSGADKAVGGNVTVSSTGKLTLGETAAATVGGKLDASTLELKAKGALTVGGDFYVKNAFTNNGALTVDGTSTLDGAFTQKTGATATLSGKTTVTGAFTQEKGADATFESDAIVNGALTNSGSLKALSTLTPKAGMANSGTVSAVGALAVTGALTNSGQLTTGKLLTAAGGITNTGTIVNNGGTIGSNVNNTNGILVGGSVGINKDKAVTVTGGTTAGLTVADNSLVNGASAKDSNSVMGGWNGTSVVKITPSSSAADVQKMLGGSAMATVTKDSGNKFTIKLNADLVLRHPLVIDGADVTIDLGGHDLSGADGADGANGGKPGLDAPVGADGGDGIPPIQGEGNNDITINGPGSISGGDGGKGGTDEDGKGGNGGNGAPAIKDDGNGHITVNPGTDVSGGNGGNGGGGSDGKDSVTTPDPDDPDVPPTITPGTPGGDGGNGGGGAPGIDTGTGGGGQVDLGGDVTGGGGGDSGTGGNGGKGDDGKDLPGGKPGDKGTDDEENTVGDSPIFFSVRFALGGTKIPPAVNNPTYVQKDTVAAPTLPNLDNIAVEVLKKADGSYNQFLTLPKTISVTMNGKELPASAYTYTVDTTDPDVVGKKGTVSLKTDMAGAIVVTVTAVPVSKVEPADEDELEDALEAGVPDITVDKDLVFDKDVTIPPGTTVTVKPGGSITVKPPYDLTVEGGLELKPGEKDKDGNLVKDPGTINGDVTIVGGGDGPNDGTVNGGNKEPHGKIDGDVTISGGGKLENTDVTGDVTVTDEGTIKDSTIGGDLNGGKVDVEGDVTVGGDVGENTVIEGDLPTKPDGTTIPGLKTLSFEPNGGSAIPSQYVAAKARTVTPTDPVKSAYAFAGWNQDEALSQSFTFGSYLTEDLTLYADWMEGDNENGGTGTGGDGSGTPTRPGVMSPKKTGVDQWLNWKDHTAYMKGVGSDFFRPDATITRAEVAQMFYNLLLNQNVTATVRFDDVPAGKWYTTAVETLASLGVIKGAGDGTFHPEKPITRAEFVAIATRFAQRYDKAACSFSDVSPSAWYYQNVAEATTFGWIIGYGDGTFRPMGQIQRAEAATIMNRMLARTGDKSFLNTHADSVRSFTDLALTHWAYDEIMEATNTHSYRVSNSKETWSALK